MWCGVAGGRYTGRYTQADPLEELPSWQETHSGGLTRSGFTIVAT